MRVAAIQMASGSNISGNLLEAEKLISRAVADGAEMVVLPENFGMIGVKPNDVVACREKPGAGPLQDFLAEQSADHAIIIAGGTIPLESDDASHYRNTMLIYNQQGVCIARYDKIHLFDVALPDEGESYHESAVIQSGVHPVVVDLGSLKLGLAVCYDLRFPELFRLLIDKGADVILLPAAFTAVTGKAHWHALLKARAIENLSFVVASAQGGYHVNGRETYGHSLILDPWGNVLDEIKSGSGYAIADLNLSQQKQLRKRFPVLSHRKFFVHE
ncbi:MAG: carbon-nitrogen hydrolase family protein [Gammaproteobacteria bacterium]|nr:carbon-nitrogen hydrolase family protein [Gammaproteobacteria bacterium]